MEALLYDLEITTDIPHGWKKTIKEIYVPDFNIFINNEACFISVDKVRLDKVKNKKFIEVDKTLIADIVKSIESREKIESKLRVYQDRLATHLKEEI